MVQQTCTTIFGDLQNLESHIRCLQVAADLIITCFHWSRPVNGHSGASLEGNQHMAKGLSAEHVETDGFALFLLYCYTMSRNCYKLLSLLLLLRF